MTPAVRLRPALAICALLATGLARADVVVTQVDIASAGARAGLVAGDVIREVAVPAMRGAEAAGRATQLARTTGSTTTGAQAGRAIAWHGILTPLEWRAAEGSGAGTLGTRLRVIRGETTIELTLAQGTLGATVVPRVDAPLSAGILAALDAAKAAPPAQVARRLQALAATADAAHEAAAGTWLIVEAARFHARDGDAAAALEAVAEARRRLGASEAPWPVEARALADIGTELDEAGRADESAPLLGEARRLLEREAPGSRLHTEVLHAMGRAALLRGDDDVAKDDFESAIRLSVAGGDALGRAVGLVQRGYRELWIYDNTAALKTLLDARERIRAIEPGGANEAEAEVRLALLARQTDRFDQAEAHARAAMDLLQRRDPPEGLERAGYELGVAATLQGRAREAEALFDGALGRIDSLRPQSRLRGSLLNALGRIKHRRGDYAGAVRYGRQALALFEARGSVDDVAAALHGLAFTSLYLKRYDDAEHLGQRSLEAAQASGAGPAGLASAWTILGQAALETGRLDLAQERYEKALALGAKEAPDSDVVWDCWYSFGLIAMAHGDAAKAREWQSRALGIVMRRQPESLLVAMPEFELGRIDEAQGALEPAIGHYRRAVAAYESTQKLLGGSLEDQGRFHAQHARYYRALIAAQLRQGREGEAFEILERYRSQLLLDIGPAGTGDVALAPPPDVARRLGAIQSRHDAALDRLRELPAGDAKADALLIELDVTRRDLASARDAFIASADARSLASVGITRTPPVDAVRAALPEGTVLLSYAVTDRETFLFRVRRDGLRVVTLPIGRDALAAKVDAWRALLSLVQPNAQLRMATNASAFALYQALLEPIAPELGSANRIVVLADGPLHALPFGALVTQAPIAKGERARYLIERHAIAHAPSAAQFLATHGTTSPGAATASTHDDASPVAGRAAPVSATLFAHTDGAQTLPWARDEVEAIRALYGRRARVYVDGAATEARAKAVGRETRVLHFATHAVLDEQAPLDSYLVLSGTGGSDNGQLQAWEIAQQMRLDADLVTLAACDTAMGRDYAGAGQLGLHAAFRYAGARVVLGTLWRVPDRDTRDLMVAFYRAIASGLPADRALQRAQVAMIEAEASAPASGFHWAAFEVDGAGQ